PASRACNRALLNRRETALDHRRNLTAPLSPGGARPSSPCIAVLSHRACLPSLSPSTPANHVRKTPKLLPGTQKPSSQAERKRYEPQPPPRFHHPRSPCEPRRSHPLLAPGSWHDDGRWQTTFHQRGC